MTMVNVYGARRAAEVMQSTWGHLAPKAEQVYTGTIVWAHGAYGDLVAIAADFAGLDDSPWLYEDIEDFLIGQESTRGTVYRFEGTYCRDRDAPFVGTSKAVNL